MKEIIKEANKIAGVEKMDLYFTDDELRKQDYDQGMKDGIIEGKKEGIIEGKKELILNMKEQGLDIEKIASISKLPVDEVEKIINY